MNLSFKKVFDELEAQRETTLQSVRHLTEEQLNRPVFPGKWSVSQILSHLIAAERMSHSYIQKKMQGIQDASDSGWREEIKINLLKISQRFPAIKFQAPRKVIENTAPYHDLTIIQKEWDSVRSDFRTLLAKITDQQVKKMVYRHPIAGYLNIEHCLIFFREHITHHTPQIEKLLRQK